MIGNKINQENKPQHLAAVASKDQKTPCSLGHTIHFLQFQTNPQPPVNSSSENLHRRRGALIVSLTHLYSTYLQI